LVFFRDRIELCGVAVVSSGRSSQMWTILDTLRQRLDERRYKAFSCNALADIVGCDGGQGSIAGSVRDFRRHVAEALGRELGRKVERDDVIQTFNGYRLNPWIVVKDLRNTGSCPATDGRPNAGRDPVNTGPDDPVNERRRRILDELRKGEQLRAPALADRLGCSHSTVKRELEALKAEGRITFVGPSKTGYYTLAEAASA